MRKILMGFILSLIIIFIILQMIPFPKVSGDNPWIRSKDDDVDIIAHGGGKLLNPENTIMAFDFAYELGSILEMDVALTKDLVLVTHHDLTLDRMSECKGYISDYNYDAIKDCNFGYGFKDLDGNYPYRDREVDKSKLYLPTLEEVFKRYPNTKFIIEIKDENDFGMTAAEELYKLIEKYEYKDKVIVGSYFQEVMHHFIDISKNEIYYSIDETTAYTHVGLTYSMLSVFNTIKAHGIQFPMSYVVKGIEIPLATKTMINRSHRQNMFVHFWTINDKEEMKRLIKLGADGIITDRMDLLIEAIEEVKQEK